MTLKVWLLVGALLSGQLLSTGVAVRVLQQSGASRQGVLIVLAVSGATLLLNGALAVVMVRRVTAPLRTLAVSARTAATKRLPEAVALLRRRRGEVVTPVLPAIDSISPDADLQTLTAALNQLQETALQLAVEQRRSEASNAETLVNLGRRNQALLTRTLGYLAQLESETSDPKLLAQLYRLDHLTTRIRRHAESMLVLAGAEQSRAHTRPVSVSNVLRAALTEIEDYHRVDVSHIEPATIAGSSAGDVTHLIAELLENATRFSPATSTVVLETASSDRGYRVAILDEGLGMSQAERGAAAGHLADAGRSDGDTKRLGLQIVGRLAARHDIEVVLTNRERHGLLAEVYLPSSVLGLTAVDEAPMTAIPAQRVSLDGSAVAGE